MRNLKVFAVAAVAGLLVAGSLQAQTATGLTAWRGVNGTWGSYNNTGSGSATWNVYTSPYRAAFEIPSLPTNAALLPPAGTSGFGPTWDIYCVDFNHYANTNNTTGYQTFFTNLGDANVGSYLGVYTRNSVLTNYLAAAYLAQQVQADPTNSGLYNGAIWYIMSGQPVYWSNGGWVDVRPTAIAALTTGYKSVNASDWVVVTDGYQGANTDNRPVLGNSQEYLTQVTPEPATLLLLGTGLVVMLMAAGAFRRPTV